MSSVGTDRTGRSQNGKRSPTVQVFIIVLLMAVYVGLGMYFCAMLHTDVVYSHVAYIPIILAGMWWGRKGVLVAGLLAAALLLFHLFGIAGGELWTDVARGSLFVIVALLVGTLSEKVIAAQNALAISENKYRLLIEKSLTGIFVYRNDLILFANPRFSGMLGYTPDEMIGRSIWSLIYEPDRDKVQELVAKRKAEGFSDLEYECRLVRNNGGIIWAEVASSVANFEAEPAVLVNVYDITDRKESENKQIELSELSRKQEEQLVHSTRLAELGEMAAAIAHELNQPLTGIRNFARNAFYMLEKQIGSSDEVKNNLRLISEQVDRASKIINQMRELTRRSERQFSQVNINGVIRESVEFLKPQLRLSEVDVFLDLTNDLPDIRGDRIRLEQVFLNLLTNARQAMEEADERRLTIRTYLDASAECSIIAEIEDTGKGFTQEVARKLFTPFFSTKKAGHGTGLGLSISLSIIKDHRGNIEAKGEPGKGAKFTVRLPVPREGSAPGGHKGTWVKAQNEENRLSS
jgi:histidine kinase